MSWWITRLKSLLLSPPVWVQLLHWFPEDVPLSSLASTLVGMANNEGGTVILGVSPRAGELVGVIDLEAARERIFQAAIQADPTLVSAYSSPGEGN